MANIMLKHGAFHLRVYSNIDVRTGELLPANDNGKVLRKLQSVLLVRQDDGQHRTKGSPAVLQLASDRIREIESWEERAESNAKRGKIAPDSNMKVSDFYETIFLPLMEKLADPKVGKVKHSTLTTYKRYWQGYLKNHFNGSKTLRNYEAYMGSQWLEDLQKSDGTLFGTNTVRKIHSVASKIFTIAIEQGFVTRTNPWHEIKLATKPTVNAEQGVAFTEAEIAALIRNLDLLVTDPAFGTRPTRIEQNVKIAQTVLALGMWGGLRPSEIVGLKWENVDLNAGTVTVLAAVVYGREKGTKTGKTRVVTLSSPAVPILRQWHEYSGSLESGFVFQNARGGVIDLGKISDRIIWPVAEKMGLTEWKGEAFYGCRRGYGTLSVLSGSTLEEVAAAMGNSPNVVYKYYFEDDKKSELAAQVAERYARLSARNSATNGANGASADALALALPGALPGGKHER